MKCIIIKLMNGGFKMEREIAHLGEEDYKKLFPEEYYQKYAEHLNILKFQQTLFQNTHARPPQSSFTDRRKPSSLINLDKVNKIRLNRYDPILDTISKNKVETYRMEKFLRELNFKIKEGPPKNGQTIRSPLVGYSDLPQSVLNKMRIIQNEQYSNQLKKIREKRRGEKDYVIFKIRNRSTSASRFSIKIENSIIADSAESHSICDKNMSNTMQLHALELKEEKGGSRSLTYQQRLQQLMVEAKSQVVSINPEDKYTDVKYILTLNRSIRKINTLKDEMRSERRKRSNCLKQTIKQPFAEEKKPEGMRKNLISMTDNIRRQGGEIQVLSRYRELLKERQLKQFLLEEQNRSPLARGR